MAESSWQPMMSAAQRRRQRRLRSWWRHEQQSIAAALATSEHHSALRGQKKARAGEGDFELNFAAKIRRHPPPQAAGTVYYPMDVDDVPAASGSRPDRLLDVSGPQEPVQRRTMEQIVDPVPEVPLLDAPVPQMVDKLEDVLKIVDLFVPAQEIEVPRISSPSCPPPRRVLRSPQMAEQLVDVPVPSVREVTIMAPFVDTAGRTWYWLSRPDGRSSWWLAGTSYHQGGDHRQPRAVYKYWARMRIFYGPLYLAVTCSVLVCLRSTCVDFFLGDDFWINFRVQRFLVRQWIHVSSSLRRLLYSDPSIDSRPALICFRIQRTAWSSVVHVMRQSTEFHVFLREKVEYGS